MQVRVRFWLGPCTRLDSKRATDWPSEHLIAGRIFLVCGFPMTSKEDNWQSNPIV